MRVDTRIKTEIRVQHDRPDIYLHHKKINEIILIEVGIKFQNLLTQVENEKKRKYDYLASELSLTKKCKTKIILYVMT